MSKFDKEIKPCPFCGGAARIWACPNMKADVYEAWVTCGECGANVAGKDAPLKFGADILAKRSALNRWNTRAKEATE